MPDFPILLEQRSSSSMPSAVQLGVSPLGFGTPPRDRNPNSQAKPACYARGMLGKRVADSRSKCRPVIGQCRSSGKHADHGGRFIRAFCDTTNISTVYNRPLFRSPLPTAPRASNSRAARLLYGRICLSATFA